MKNDYEKLLGIIDMNEGFVNVGAMANPLYNQLVPEQLKLINKFREEHGEILFVNEGHNHGASEFKKYPEHCVVGTKESELIPEFKGELLKDDTEIYYKNSINGMLNRKLQDRIIALKHLKEIVLVGVCADLCVMDFARTLSRFLDELDRDVKIFVIENAIDTFDAPFHERDKWLSIAKLVMEQAGIVYVKDINELEQKEKVYKN